MERLKSITFPDFRLPYNNGERSSSLLSEIWTKIFSYLNRKNVSSVSLTCYPFYFISSQNAFWKQRFYERFPFLRKEGEHFKILYLNQLAIEQTQMKAIKRLISQERRMFADEVGKVRALWLQCAKEEEELIAFDQYGDINVINLLTLSKGKIETTYAKNMYFAQIVSTGNDRYLCHVFMNKLSLWNIQLKQEVGTLSILHGDEIKRAAILKDEKTLSLIFTDKDNLYIWNPCLQAPSLQIALKDCAALAASQLDNKSYLVVAASEGLLIFDFVKQDWVKCEFDQPIEASAISAIKIVQIRGAVHAITGTKNGVLQLWNLETMQHCQTLQGPHKRAIIFIESLFINELPVLAVARFDNLISLVHFPTLRLIGQINTKSDPHCIAVQNQENESRLFVGIEESIYCWKFFNS